MSRRYTEEDIRKEIFDTVGDEYSMVGEYKNKSTKVLMRHNTCGNEWEVSMKNFFGNRSKKGTRCPKCAKIITFEEMSSRIINKYEDEFTLIDRHVDEKSVDYIKVKHNKCGNIRIMRWQNLLNVDYKCIKCGNNRGMETHDDFMRYFNMLDDSVEYEVLSEFTTVKNKIKLKHIKCGYEFYVLPLAFLGYKNRKGTRCKVCTSIIAGNKRRGKNNSTWKGGVTPLKNHLRKVAILQWKKDSMKACDYKCDITGDKFDHIHHIYSFTKIFEDTMQELSINEFKQISEYTESELKYIEKHILENHYKYGLGVCLKKNLHDLFHIIYGKIYCGEKEYNEFKLNCLSGKYDEELKIKMGVS